MKTLPICQYFLLFFCFLGWNNINAQFSCPEITRGPYIQPDANSEVKTEANIYWRTDDGVDVDFCYRPTTTSNNAITTCITISAYGHWTYTPFEYGEKYSKCTVFDYEANIPIFSLTDYEIRCKNTNEVLAQGQISIYPEESTPVNIWVIGDGGSSNFTEVKEAYHEQLGDINNDGLVDDKDIDTDTDVLLMLGDNAYTAQADDDPDACYNSYTACPGCRPDGGDYAYQDRVFDPLKEILPNTIMWTTIGNHEVDYDTSGDLNIEEFFPLFPNLDSDNSYYSFDYGKVHFVCLNSEISAEVEDQIIFSNTMSDMKTWLVNDLNLAKQNSTEWTIVYFHHPIHAAGPRYQRNTLISDADAASFLNKIEFDMRLMIDNVAEILDTFEVDLVMNGHNHHYERSFLVDGYYNANDYSLPLFDDTDSTMLLDDGCNGCHADYTSQTWFNNYDYTPYDDSYFLKEDKGTVYMVMGASSKLDFHATYHDFYNHPMMRPFTDPSLISDDSDFVMNGGRGLHKQGSGRLSILSNKLVFEYVVFDEIDGSSYIGDKFTIFKKPPPPITSTSSCIDDKIYVNYSSSQIPLLPSTTMVDETIKSAFTNVTFGNTVTFQAGDYIELQSMFDVSIGANFTAQIAPCDPTKSNAYKETVDLNKNRIHLNYDLKKKGKVSVYLYNQENKVIKKVMNKSLQARGKHKTKIGINDLLPGNYFVEAFYENTLLQRIDFEIQ